MKNLQYIPLQKGNEQQYPLLESLMLPYTAELDEHAERKMPQHIILKWIKSIQNMQGPADRHFEFCYDGDTLIGFTARSITRITEASSNPAGAM